MVRLKHRLRHWRGWCLDVALRVTERFDDWAIEVGSRCYDCGSSEDLYVLKDEVWAATGMGEHGFLCTGCVEQRLGRELTRADFTDAPVNDLEDPPLLGVRTTHRQADRLKG